MSATGFLDACGFFPTAGGTGDFVVSAAVTGYQTPASAGVTNGAVYSYRAQSTDLSQWEVGFGAYTSGTTTLARTTVMASSTGSKVNFTAPPSVYVTALSADLLNASLFTSGTVPTARLPLGTGANQVPQLDAAGKLLNAVMGASSIGSSGYYTLPGGLIVQWGVTANAVSGETTTAFPITFPNNVFVVLSVLMNANATSSLHSIVVHDITKTEFSATHKYQSTSTTGTSSLPAFYFAIGN